MYTDVLIELLLGYFSLAEYIQNQENILIHTTIFCRFTISS